MKKFIIEQSNDEFYTSHSGLALVGLCLNRFSELSQKIRRKITRGQKEITTTDIIFSMLGLLCLGKSDFEAITPMRDDDYFYIPLG